MQRHLVGVFALMLGFSSTPVLAQQFLGRLGAACVQLPASRQQFIPLTIAAPAGATLIVTVAASSNFVSGLEIDDSVGTRYQALGGVRNGVAGSLVHFRAALQRAIPAGQLLLLSYENAAANVYSCASVLAYSGIPFGGIVQETLGATSGQSNTPAVTATAPASSARKLVLAGFATNGAPGSITPAAPASAQPALCASGNSLCLLDAQYFDSAAGAAGISLALGNSVAWTGALTTLQADGIFGNGFD